MGNQFSDTNLSTVISFDVIRRLAATLPGTVETTSYGTPAIKVGKKLLLRLHQKEDAIVLMLDSVEEQQALIERDPMTFYITDHYQHYPAVLVRPTIDASEFTRLMERAWRSRATRRDITAYQQASQ